MIYEMEDGGYVIASQGMWLTGAYATKYAARYAFQFTDEELLEIRDKRPGTRPHELITTEHLRAYRRDHPKRKKD